jgi:hypothetical protein
VGCEEAIKIDLPALFLMQMKVQKLLCKDAADHEQHSLHGTAWHATKNWLSINAPIFWESYHRVKPKWATASMRLIREHFNAQ